MKDKVKNFLKKGNYNKIKLSMAVVVSIIISILLITIVSDSFIWDIIPIFSVIILFVLLHFIFNLDKMYEWIYKKRFLIALVIFIYCVVMEYSGSSIGMYNVVIQPESTQEYFEPILGTYRSIRSDEWSVSTPIFASQSNDEDSKFSYYNDNLRGTMTDMFSIINSPVRNILTLGKLFNIGFLLFGLEKGLAFAWYGKVISLMLISFEFCMLITDKKKLYSLFGMILITFSAGVQWWNSTEFMIWGMLAILLIDKFMITKSYKSKILYSIGIFICGICYIFIFYPAWQIPYGLVYLACIVWLWLKNKYKINWKDFLIILFVILAIGGFCLYYFKMSNESLNITMNTDYPGERFEIGGGGTKTLFSYVYSFLFPYKSCSNPCEMSGMTSYFPIPLIISLIYIIRNKNRKQHMKFYIPMFIITIILAIFTIFPTNRIFAKMTLLYMSPASRVAIPLGLLQIMLLLYTMGHINEDDKILGDKISKIVAFILSVIIFSISLRTMEGFSLGSLESYICGLILLIVIYLMLTINKEKSKKYLIGILIIVSLITGATVNPIQKGASVLNEKPVAKKIQEIVKQDKEEKLWITDSTEFYITNYVLANGAKVINSTNVYPNEELYYTVLGEDAKNEEIKKIYNRYSHIVIELIDSNEESRVELLYPDCVKLYLNVKMLEKLNIGYILTTRNLEELDTKNIKFNELYNEQEMIIYEVII